MNQLAVVNEIATHLCRALRAYEKASEVDKVSLGFLLSGVPEELTLQINNLTDVIDALLNPEIPNEELEENQPVEAYA